MNLGSGFAAGLAQGQQFTRGIADAYRAGQQMNDARDQAAQKEALKGIASATAVESTGYTADQGKELEGLAANGYKIDFDDAQKAYVARNDAGDTKTIAMQGVTDFMGERSAGSMSREQQDSTRMLAMADVIGRTDPERGLQMRQQLTLGAHDLKRQAREMKQWQQDDEVGRIEGEQRKQFQASLIDQSGKSREATMDDHLAHSQRRIAALTQAGHLKAADQATQDLMAQSHIKIQMDTKRRQEASDKAAAGLAVGDYAPLMELYNRYVPSGYKISGIEAGQGGALQIKRTDLNGREAAPVTLKDSGEALGLLKSMASPAALYQYSQGEFQRSLRPSRETVPSGLPYGASR